MPVELMANLLDCVCICHGELTSDGGFCGMNKVAIGSSVTGVTDVADITARLEGIGVNVVDATLLATGIFRF